MSTMKNNTYKVTIFHEQPDGKTVQYSTMILGQHPKETAPYDLYQGFVNQQVVNSLSYKRFADLIGEGFSWVDTPDGVDEVSKTVRVRTFADGRPAPVTEYFTIGITLLTGQREVPKPPESVVYFDA